MDRNIIHYFIGTVTDKYMDTLDRKLIFYFTETEVTDTYMALDSDTGQGYDILLYI